MSRLNKDFYPKAERKTKIILFGLNRYVKGTALTAVNSMNGDGVLDAGVVAVTGNPNIDYSKLAEQDYMYTILRQGLLDGEPFEDNSIIESLNDVVDPYKDFNAYLKLARLETLEFAFINTQDEEIVFDETDTNLKAPKSFIGKLLAFLKARYEAFGGDITKGFHFIPADKGYTDANEFKDQLVKLARACRLPNDYINWIIYSNTYAKCLIDRIIEEATIDDVRKADLVDGDYDDYAAIRTEHFYTWIIEGSLGLDKVFPAETATDIEFTDDITPYIERSDRLRGGARLALIATKEATVSQALKDIEQFVKDYIIYEAGPTVDLVDVELEFYSDNLYERYENPYFEIDNGPRYKKYLKQALLPVIYENKELAKRALLILAYFVIDDNLDLGADPDFVKIAEINGATQFLNQAIEDIKELGFVGAVKKNF